MHILILAAGYGTRLYPLTHKIAKPLVPINGMPMLNFLFDKLRLLRQSFSIKEIRIVVNDKFYESFLTWQKQYNVDVIIMNDGSSSPENRLGAIQDMRFGIDGTGADWLILGGDNLFEDTLKQFVSFSLSNKPYPSVGLYDVGNKEEASRCGVVDLDSKKRIVKFQEKPKEPFSTLAASCVYFFPQESLVHLDTFAGQNHNVDAAGKYIEWLVDEAQVYGYLLQGKWIDIGHVDSLKLAEEQFQVQSNYLRSLSDKK